MIIKYRALPSPKPKLLTMQESPEVKLPQTLQYKHIKRLLHAREKKIISKKGGNVTTG